MAGPGALFAQGALVYRDPGVDLDYPVRDYDSALGVQLFVSREWRAVQVRLGYSRQPHSAGSTESVARPGGGADPLGLSAVFFGAAYTVSRHP